MMTHKADFDQYMRKIQIRFIDEIPVRLDTIRAELNCIANSPGDEWPYDLNELHCNVHTLFRVATAVGLTESGAAAHTLQTMLSDLIRSRCPITPASHKHLCHAFECLAASIEHEEPNLQ